MNGKSSKDPARLVTCAVTIATANIHFGDAIRLDGGLDSLLAYAPDILLLQEVTNPVEELERQLSKISYSLVHFAPEFGLAIALWGRSKLRFVPGTIRTQLLQKMGAVENRLAQRFAKQSHAMNAHGMQAAQFKVARGHTLTVVNTRTSVSSNRIGRKRQLVRMGNTLKAPYYSGAVVMGGDMYHFPEPQRMDRAMRQKADLRQVNLNGEPTWRARNSKLYRLVARVRRQPLEDLEAQLDVLLYRGAFEPIDVRVVDIMSDHRAIVARFVLKEPLGSIQSPASTNLS